MSSIQVQPNPSSHSRTNLCKVLLFSTFSNSYLKKSRNSIYKLKVALFDENMDVRKSKYLVILYLHELKQPSDRVISGGRSPFNSSQRFQFEFEFFTKLKQKEIIFKIHTGLATFN